MRSSAVVLSVAIVLTISLNIVSARLYAVKADWSGSTCEPSSANILTFTEAFPSGSCLSNFLKFDCNATHVRQYDCTLNDTVCDCTISYEYAFGCSALSRGGSRSWQCIDSTFDSYVNTLRTSSQFTARLETLNYDTQCTPSATLETTAFRATRTRCFSAARKRSAESAAVVDNYNYFLQGCNATGQYFYGCNDSACTDCTAEIQGFSEFLTCYDDGGLFVNQTCLVVPALPAPIAPAPVAASTPSSAGNAPSQSNGNAPTATNAPAAPKAPSAKPPSAATKNGVPPMAGLLLMFVFASLVLM